jgi:dUTP pyrophosphatase
MAKLFIKAETEEIGKMYTEHSSAYEGDSGIDLFFPENIIIPAKGTVLIDLLIACEMRHTSNVFKLGETQLFVNKSYLLIPRSSIYKTPLRQCNSMGLIDSKYRGNIKVAVDNISDKSYEIKKGQKLFQIITGNLEPFTLVLTDNLSDSSRGKLGFGSSGL